MSDNTTVEWRQGKNYRIHVYAEDVPVATFFTSMDANEAVIAHNRALKQARKVYLDPMDDAPEIAVTRDDLDLMESLSQQVVEKSIRLVKCGEELAVHKNALEQRLKQVNALIADKEVLTKANDNQAKTISTLSGEVDEMRERRDSAVGKCDSLVRDKAELRGKYAAAVEQRDRLAADLAQVNTLEQTRGLQAEISRLRLENAGLVEVVEHRDIEIRAAHDNAARCKEDLSAVKDATVEVARLHSELERTRVALGKSDAKAEQYKSKYQTAERSRVRLAEIVEDVADTPVMAPVVGSGQRLTDLVEVQRAEVVRLRDEVERLASELRLVRDTAEATASNLRSQLSRCKADKERLSELVEQMRDVKARPAASLDAVAQIIRTAFYAGVVPGVPWEQLPGMEKRVWLDMAVAAMNA